MKLGPNLIRAICFISALFTLNLYAAEIYRVTQIEGFARNLTESVEVLLQVGDKIQGGSTIATGEKSALVLVGQNGQVFKLNSNSRIELGVEADHAKLIEGNTFIRIEKRQASESKKPVFQLRTRTAVLGVRGTLFFAGVTSKPVQEGEPKKAMGDPFPQNTWMCVREGQVEVSTKDHRANVKAGEGLFVEPGKSFAPKHFEWPNQLNWNFDPAKGAILNPKWTDAAKKEAAGTKP